MTYLDAMLLFFGGAVCGVVAALTVVDARRLPETIARLKSDMDAPRTATTADAQRVTRIFEIGPEALATLHGVLVAPTERRVSALEASASSVDSRLSSVETTVRQIVDDHRTEF